MYAQHLLAALFTALLTLAPVCALAQPGGYAGPQAQGMGGYTGPGPSVMTVSSALGLPDDAHIALKGRITSSLGGEHYMFADATGQVEVEIDAKVWQGQSVGPDDTVIIYGEVDKELMRPTKIDVKRLVKQ